MKVPHHSAEQAIRKMGAAAQRRRAYSVADVCGALSEEALPSNSRDCTGGAIQKLRLHQAGNSTVSGPLQSSTQVDSTQVSRLMTTRSTGIKLHWRAYWRSTLSPEHLATSCSSMGMLRTLALASDPLAEETKRNRSGPKRLNGNRRRS